MQIYLLAVNLFALAALLLGLTNSFKGTYQGRLLPLFLLVVGRSLALIFFMAWSERGQPIALVAALNVFSTFCIVWSLTGSYSGLLRLGRNLVWLGASAAVLLSLTPLLPFWPIPSELHSLAIAVFGGSFILVSNHRRYWIHLAAPCVLALASFLSLLGLNSVSWFMNLLAYTLLINAIHTKVLASYCQSLQVYKSREAVTEALARETSNLSRERERLLDVVEIIGSVPNLSQSMEYLVSSVARATHADQSVLFMLNPKIPGQLRLVAVYNPQHPFHITSRDEITFELGNYPLLQEAIAGQQQLLLPHQYMNGLRNLYALWEEVEAGPTLIQPLTIQRRSVGLLILGNPVTNRPFREQEVHLCRVLAPQMATMVEYRRRYLELEFEAETMAARLQQQIGPGPQPSLDNVDPYRQIVEAIGDGVVVSDTSGRVQFANQAIERILNKPRRELLGQSIGSLYGEIDSRETIEDLLVAFSRRNQPLPTFIEDEQRAIQGRLVPWRNSQSEWLGIIAIFRDVTREIKADRARDDFMAALSRELRGPLTAIKGYAELSTLGLLGQYSPEQLRVQRIMQSSADRMVAVLDNAIQISAQNRYRVLPRFAEVDIVKVIDEALREIHSLAELRELKLTREIKGELPPIIADPRHMRKILDNLLTNACQFTLPGGQVTVRAWIRSEREGNTIRPRLFLVVADTGVGIPQIDFKRIFDPFYQVENQDITEQTGMGMGLAVAKELVELHQGQIWVESVVGQGSVFQITLPITQE